MRFSLIVKQSKNEYKDIFALASNKYQNQIKIIYELRECVCIIQVTDTEKFFPHILAKNESYGIRFINVRRVD